MNVIKKEQNDINEDYNKINNIVLSRKISNCNSKNKEEQTMGSNPYPIYNDEGKLFCKAATAEDGKETLLIGKNCSIPLKELQEKAAGSKVRKQRGRKTKSQYE